jgi:hypothetical protein
MEETLLLILKDIERQTTGMMNEVQTEFDAFVAETSRSLSAMMTCAWIAFILSVVVLGVVAYRDYSVKNRKPKSKHLR